MAGVNITLSASFYPENQNKSEPPPLSAKAALVWDLDSAVKLFAKNENQALPSASTTKIMTAVVAMDDFKPGQVLEVPKLSVEGQDIGLRTGEKMTIESLLFALLVASANDAAETIAANFSSGREAFIEKMNEKASELFLSKTSFVNPTGMDEDDQKTSVFDLVVLAKEALKNPFFSKAVSTQKIIVPGASGERHALFTINELLGKIKGVLGVKTGLTEEAGECLVTYVNREGKKLLIVVLGSEDRFGETEKLIAWTFENFTWEKAN